MGILGLRGEARTAVKIWIGITDGDWFEFLRARRPDEVNFWQPSGARQFRVLQPGEPLLFKLHSPRNYIVGGGFFINLNQTLIQGNTPAVLMGRVMSLHTLGFLGFAPLGALLAGVMAALLSAPSWMALSGIILALIAAATWVSQPALRRMS